MKRKALPSQRAAGLKRARQERLERMKALPPLDESRRYPVQTAADYLSVSKDHVWDLIKRGAASGGLKIIKDGRLTFVPGSEIARLSRA